MFATTDSIERVEKNLQLPVLGFVPKISLRTKVNHQKLTSDHLHSKTLPQIRNNIPVIESYREIRSNLQHAINQEQLKTFLFTSPNPGEGKSLTAGNVAICMAMDGKRVVYVDSDLRKGVGSFLLIYLQKGAHHLSRRTCRFSRNSPNYRNPQPFFYK
ncbi:hypothetical protein AAHB46_00405 [Bacillus paranthracis]